MRNAMLLILGIIIMLGAVSGQQTKYEPNWESLDQRAVAPWFEDAKFGIFIHWGPYSVPAWTPKGTYSEWYQYWLQTKTLFGNGDFSGTEVYDFHVKTYGKDFSYYQFADMFTNDLFDPEAWVDLFEKSGARYVVTTTKHHDGYCLWPSKEANDRGFPWNSAEVGAKRDIVGDLTRAMRRSELKVGFYYSLYEWFHPWWEKDKERFINEHFHPQFKDLITRYEPDIIWGDGEWDLPPEKWKTPELLAWLFNESPVKEKIVINDRWGAGVRKKHGGYYTTEYESSAEFNRPWEECRGMGFSFGYNRNEDAQDYNSAQTLVLMLIDIVSNGGNLLLDIGPDARGRIPVIMQERLLQIGRWLDTYGEAIYGTRKWKRNVQWSDGEREYKPEGQHYLGGDYILKQTVDPEPGYARKEIFFTTKGGNLYATTPRWPGKTLTITDFNAPEDARVRFLASGEELHWSNEGGSLIINMPPYNPNALSAEEQYAYAFEISGVRKHVRAPQIQITYYDIRRKPEVVLTTSTKGVGIYYTLDGTIPTRDSRLYTEPLVIDNSAQIRVKAFKSGFDESKTVDEYISVITKYEDILLSNEPENRYSGKGVITLADDIRGSTNIQDGKWLGFEGVDFEAIIDLGEIKIVKKVLVGCLSDQNSWIFIPKEVSCQVSANEKDYREVERIENEINKDDESKIFDIKIDLPEEEPIRYVKILLKNVRSCPDWHKGSGGPAWLFVDEIDIE